LQQHLREHLPGPDVLTPEQQVGSPDDYCAHNLHVELDGSFSIVGLVWRPGQHRLQRPPLLQLTG
jgi:hypothetical protein